nr:protein EI24 homolog [Ipomoea trifida]
MGRLVFALLATVSKGFDDSNASVSYTNKRKFMSTQNREQQLEIKSRKSRQTITIRSIQLGFRFFMEPSRKIEVESTKQSTSSDRIGRLIVLFSDGEQRQRSGGFGGLSNKKVKAGVSALGGGFQGGLLSSSRLHLLLQVKTARHPHWPVFLVEWLYLLREVRIFLLKSVIVPALQWILPDQCPQITSEDSCSCGGILEFYHFLRLGLVQLFYVFWFFPLYVLSLILSNIWYNDIAKHGFFAIEEYGASGTKLSDQKDSQTSQKTVSKAKSTDFEGYKWNLSGLSLDKRLDFFETNWAFFAGFGSPCALAIFLFSPLVSYGVMAILFPLFVLTATGSEADKIVSLPRTKWRGAGLGRVPIFYGADYVSISDQGNRNKTEANHNGWRDGDSKLVVKWLKRCIAHLGSTLNLLLPSDIPRPRWCDGGGRASLPPWKSRFAGRLKRGANLLSAAACRAWPLSPPPPAAANGSIHNVPPLLGVGATAHMVVAGIGAVVCRRIVGNAPAAAAVAADAPPLNCLFEGEVEFPEGNPPSWFLLQRHLRRRRLRRRLRKLFQRFGSAVLSRFRKRRGESRAAATERDVERGEIRRDGAGAGGGDDSRLGLMQEPLNCLAVGLVPQFPRQLENPSGASRRHADAPPSAVHLRVPILRRPGRRRSSAAMLVAVEGLRSGGDRGGRGVVRNVVTL